MIIDDSLQSKTRFLRNWKQWELAWMILLTQLSANNRETSNLQFLLLFLFLGCACRFLYGPETKDEHKGQIEKSLDGKLELKLEVIFYKKNGKKITD